MAIIYGAPDSVTSLLAKLPKEVKNVEDMDRVRKKFYGKMKNQRKGFGRKSITGMIFSEIKRYHYKRQVDKFQYKKVGRLETGAKGELEVLRTLSKLDDNYHVFCELDLELENWLSYQGERNLKSAQMDFVVVSRRGVIMIEVKNWSTKYFQNHDGLSPYEQTERAGKVLWAFLNDEDIEPRVTNVLLPLQNNMEWNRDYKFVSVCKLRDIISFIEKKPIQLSENVVEEIIDILED